MYFCDFLEMVCQIDANDTALESYAKCAIFAYRKYFSNSLWFKFKLEYGEIDFERGFFLSLSKWGK